MAFAASNIVTPGRVLDVGVGRGHFLKHLINSGKASEAFGADIVYSEAAKRRLDKADLQFRSVVDLDFEDNFFDYVTCFEVLEHLDSYLTDRAIAQLRRVCRQHLFVSMPFDEPVPLSRHHRQRFGAARIQQLFPRAEVEILSKIETGKVPWVYIYERQDARP